MYLCACTLYFKFFDLSIFKWFLSSGSILLRMLFNMNFTRICTKVSIKHCSMCQGDTEYYCYGCQQHLCIQCKKLHVIDLSTKDHEITSHTEKMKYSPKQVQSSQSQNPKQVIIVHSLKILVKNWKDGDLEILNKYLVRDLKILITMNHMWSF